MDAPAIICSSIHHYQDYSYKELAGYSLPFAIEINTRATYHDELCDSTQMLVGAQLLSAEYVEITDLCSITVDLQLF